MIIGFITYMLVALCQLCPLESAHTANAQVCPSPSPSPSLNPLVIIRHLSSCLSHPPPSPGPHLVVQVILSLICAYSAFSVAESYFEVRRNPRIHHRVPP